MERRLYRSRTDRMIAGVCGGLADYLGVDTILVRLIFVLLTFANGLGLIAYLVLAIFVPRGRLRVSGDASPSWDVLSEHEPSQPTPARGPGLAPAPSDDTSWLTDDGARARRRYMGGIFLLIVGVVFLLINFNLLWWLDLGRFWPLILVAIGVVILLQRARR